MERHGLSSRIAKLQLAPTGELSAMAFLVGVICRACRRSPPPDASSGLARLLNSQGAQRWPVQTADASPSPLVRIEGTPSMQGEVKSGA